MLKIFLRTAVLTAFILCGLAGTKRSAPLHAMLKEEVEKWIKKTDSEVVTARRKAKYLPSSLIPTAEGGGARLIGHEVWDVRSNSLKKLLHAQPTLAQVFENQMWNYSDKSWEKTIQNLRDTARYIDKTPEKERLARVAAAQAEAAAKAERDRKEAEKAKNTDKVLAIQKAPMENISAYNGSASAAGAGAAPRDDEAHFKRMAAESLAKKAESEARIALLEEEEAQLRVALLKAWLADLKPGMDGGVPAAAGAGAGAVKK